MSLDGFETEELTAAFSMMAVDGKLDEARCKAFLDLLDSGLSADDVHDMFIVGGGKDGFDEKSWLGAFEHKDHGDQDDEVTSAFGCVSAGGNLDMAKAQKLMALAGLELKPKEFDEFKNIADYNSDGKVDMGDFVNMIHATI
eukprot:TRINITY_DN5069_c0_g1_i1.p1 TRINITY_DN5069_c0_g1~~TRINITY_DN5069_c0_g1_i1.p1  ORF type:complete len:142 (-),score=34.37 TRINITY_DN5069_c0_g1_i1:80-505(-)